MRSIACLLLLTVTGYGADFQKWTVADNSFVKQTPAGLRFDAAGVGYAYTSWDIQAKPFALTWDVEIERGVAQAWRYPGVAVALTTAPPDQMGDNDLAILISLHLDGITADVRQGRLYDPNRNETGHPPPFSRMEDRSLAKRFDLNQGGAGGRWYSVQWPNNDLPGTQLSFRIVRTPADVLQFEFYHREFEDGREPWWQKEWTLPANVAKANFQYVVVKTVINPGDYKNPSGKPEGGAMVGLIRNLRGGPPTNTIAAASAAREPLNDTGPHPYLYYRAADLPALRKKFNDPQFANYRKLILANADAVPAAGAVTEKSGRAGIAALTWAYVLSGDARYKERLLPVLETESRSLQHEEFRMMAAHDMALAYDALFAELPAPLRGRMQRYLERAATVYVRNVKKRAWWYAGNPSNTIPVGAAGGGAAGLALMHCSAIAREAAELAGPTTKRAYRGLAPDGGCVEGTLYWNYGLTAYLRLAHMLQTATGKDAGLLDTPELRRNYRFVETQLAGDGLFFTFNDTQPWLTGFAICADLGCRFNQPLLLWLADYMAGQFAAGIGTASENARSDIVPYAFLWRCRLAAPKEFPGVPTVSYLETMHWGVLRSDSSFRPKLVVGIKGQDGVLTHHAQADLGSFVVYANGEPVLIDPGYFQSGADAHSLPLINGVGPDARGKARITATWDRGMTLDATAAYKSATRVRRHFDLVADQAVVVVDDIVARGTVRTLFQSGVATAVDKTTAILTGQRGALRLQVFGPVEELKREGPRDFGRSWIFRRWAENGQITWYTLSGEYAAGEPLVTVIGNVPATVRRTADQLVVQVAGQTLGYRKKQEGWQRE